VAHAWRVENNLRLFHKVTGASLCNYTLAQPRSLAFSVTNGDLWVVDGSGVTRYAIPLTCDGTPLTPMLTLGTSEVAVPGAIATGPFSDRLFVLDLATQQVRIFVGSTGLQLSPLGRAGG